MHCSNCIRRCARKARVLLVDELYHGLTYDGDAHTALAVSDDILW